ncbi:MAG: hypothetical protein ACE5D2_08425 [Fidelibacterota bacterium]
MKAESQKNEFLLIRHRWLVLLVSLVFCFYPLNRLQAQDEEGSTEIFWGEEDTTAEEDFNLEDFGFEEEDTGAAEEDLGGFEFDEEPVDAGLEEETSFDDAFAEDEFVDEEPVEEDLSEVAQRMGYTLNLVGASPSFVNHQLNTYNSAVDFRVAFEFPMLLQLGPVRFRLGAEVGTFKFTNYKPVGGTFSGISINGILSFPAGPGQVKLGSGMIGGNIGFIAENSYGFTIGNSLDVRLGIRSTTAFNVVDSKKQKLGTVSWMDGLVILGISI